MAKWKAAVIGCGGAGNQHADGYTFLPDVEFVGAVDIDASKAEALTKRIGGRAYTSYEQMILTEKPDIVSICTREYDHEQPALFALKNGCHVLSEKLMAHTLEAGHRMVEAARKHRRRLGVNYNYRFIDSVRLLKDKLNAEALGEIKLASFQVHAYCHHHTLDLIRYLFGDVDHLNATLTEIDSERNYPWNNADELLYIPSYNEATTFRIGKTLVTLTACHHSFEFPLLEIRVIGTKGQVFIRDMKFRSINGDFKFQSEHELDVVPPSELSLENTFHRSVASWVNSLNGNTTDSATGEDGMKALLLEHAIVQSNREQRDVAL